MEDESARSSDYYLEGYAEMLPLVKRIDCDLALRWATEDALVLAAIEAELDSRSVPLL